MGVPDIIVSTIYFLFTLGLVEWLRLAAGKVFDKSPLLQQCVQEFLAAFEMCAVCYEIGIGKVEISIQFITVYNEPLHCL